MAKYLNGCVRDLEEKLVTQLLSTEHCTSAKDLKEYVSGGRGGAGEWGCGLVI